MKIGVSQIASCEKVDKKNVPQFAYMPDGVYYKIDERHYAVFMYGVLRDLNDYTVDLDNMNNTNYTININGLILHYF